MSSADAVRQRVTISMVGLTAITLVSVLALPALILGWVIVFDETGLDEVAPPIVFTGVLPAASSALVPTIVATYLYDGRTALKLGAPIAVVGIILTTSLCGASDVAIC